MTQRLINKLRSFPSDSRRTMFWSVPGRAVRDLSGPQAVRGHPPTVQRGTQTAAEAGRKGGTACLLRKEETECLTSGNGTR